MTDERRNALNDVSNSLRFVLDDILGYANQLESSGCKREANKLRTIAGKIENEIYNMKERASL